MFRKAVLTLGVLACAFASHAPARATVMVEVLLEDMIRDADAIVVGRVKASEVRLVLTAHGSELHTLTTLTVAERLKGEPAVEITIREFGGELQGRGMRIDGTPTYRVGEHVLLFLERNPVDARHFRTYALSQGKFSVRFGVDPVPTTVSRDLSSASFASWSRGRMNVARPGSDPAIALSDMLELIRGVLTFTGAQ